MASFRAWSAPPTVDDGAALFEARAWLVSAFGRYWPAHGRFVTGLIHEREVDVLVATHGWWPWLLTLAVILIVAAFVINYFVKRRRSV
jgi:hypothetical protein